MSSAVQLHVEAIPRELRERPQWVCWRWVERDNGFLTKQPIDAKTGRPASTTDPATWSTLERALQRYQAGGVDGVGFVFSGDFTGVDLDHAIDLVTGKLNPWAQEILQAIPTYTERSISGEGVHLYSLGALPEGWLGRNKRIHDGGVEIYSTGRYFVVTGDWLSGTPETITDQSVAIQALWLQLGPNPESPADGCPFVFGLDDLDAADLDARIALALTDDPALALLWSGDIRHYKSHSEADLSLCNKLVKLLGPDIAEIDAAFRESGLYREKKWKGKYAERTIQKAMTPPPSPPLPDAPQGTPLAFNATDCGNGELLASMYGNRFRHDWRRGRDLLFDFRLHRWRQDAAAELIQLTKDAARRRYFQAGAEKDPHDRERESRWAIRSEAKQRIDAALAMARTEPEIADRTGDWDNRPMLLACANGVVDLETGILRDGTPEDRLILHTPIAYDPGARCPQFERFFVQILNHDSDLVHFVHRAMGYSLTGITTEQCLFVLYGTGANGKSVLLSVLRHALGQYAYNMPFSTVELQNRAAIPNDVAALADRRLVTAAETNDSTRLNESRIKALTGGDDLTARYLHHEFFSFKPVAKYWLAVNHKPRVADSSYGFWRRVRLIPFTCQFRDGAADPDLESKLLGELQGILTFLVRGCRLWRDQGLQPPDSVSSATEEYRQESDPLASFIEERCTLRPDAEASASALYIAYVSWAQEQGFREKELMTNTAVGRRLGERFSSRKTTNGKVYFGVQLQNS